MNFVTFGLEHNLYLIGTFAIWLIVLFTGREILNSNQRRIFVLLLIVITISQELIDDILRWNVGIWDVAEDLPLHMCCLIYTSTSPRDKTQTRMQSSA